jgi:WD40 repeat protein
VLSTAGPAKVYFGSDAKPLIIAIPNGDRKEPVFTLCDAETGKATVTFKGHVKAIKRAILSRDGKVAASSSSDQTGRIWDVATGKNTRTLGDCDGSVGNLAFSPDGKVLAVACTDDIGVGMSKRTDTIRFLEVSTGKLLGSIKTGLGASTCMAFSPDGRHFAFGSGYDRTAERTIKLWSLPEHWEGAENK